MSVALTASVKATDTKSVSSFNHFLEKKSISSTSHWLKDSGKNNPMSAKFKLFDYEMDDLAKDTLSYCNVFEKFESLGTQEDLLLTTERDVQS